MRHRRGLRVWGGEGSGAFQPECQSLHVYHVFCVLCDYLLFRNVRNHTLSYKTPPECVCTFMCMYHIYSHSMFICYVICIYLYNLYCAGADLHLQGQCRRLFEIWNHVGYFTLNIVFCFCSILFKECTALLKTFIFETTKPWRNYKHMHTHMYKHVLIPTTCIYISLDRTYNYHDFMLHKKLSHQTHCAIKFTGDS